MYPILRIGPLAIQTPGLALLIGLWIALSLAEKEAKLIARKRGLAAGVLSSEAIYNLALVAISVGIVGARLFYVLRYVDAYVADPWGIVALNPATLAQSEGILAGMIAATIWAARLRLPLWPTLDALAPALAVMGVAVAVAHMASGNAFGAATALPWRIFLWDDYRHPSQVYELLAAVAVLGVWWRQARDNPAPVTTDGASFLVAAGLTAGARLFLEGFRGDSVLLAGGVRAAQVWAWLALAACLGLLSYRDRRQPEAQPPS